MSQRARTDRSTLSEWWWTVDKVTLLAIGTLMVAGLMTGLAASPSVAERNDLSFLYFVFRQLVFLLPAVALVVGFSFLPIKAVRRIALWIFIVALILTLVAVFFGENRNGASRWL